MKEEPEFDKYRTYVDTVQDPEGTCEYLEKTYREINGVAPIIMREDFCATFAISCAWVARNSKTQAYGVDRDREPILWGIKNHFAKLPLEQQRRLRIVEADVLNPDLPTADVIAALNFSFFIFKKRQSLLAYFRNCRQTLRKNGLLVLDCFGGYETMDANEEHTRYKHYTYSWDQRTYDPITGHALFHIHYTPKGGKKRNRVFTYDWRMWSIPELTDLLAEAGFRKSRVYWEGEDSRGNGNGVYKEASTAENCPAWVVYIVGEK